MPVHTGSLVLFTRLALDQIVIPTTKYTNAEWSISGSVRNMGVNLSTYASFEYSNIPYLYSILSLTFQLPKKIIFTPQLQYDYKTGSPTYAKLSIDKRLIGNGYLDIAYQEFFNVHTRNILVGMRYDFSFSRVAVSVLQGNDHTYSRVEAASGSLIYDHKSHYLNANNRTNVGRGGIVVEPFLDINCNGVWDKGEPAAPGLKVKINGGRIIYDEKDTLVRILDMEPYNIYTMELIRSSFDNISWQIKNLTYRVTINPNNFTVIEVPVRVVGEVTGEISNLSGGSRKGQGQMFADVIDSNNVIVARALTENDGFFSYIGVPPGNYKVRVDSTQLAKLHMVASPAFIAIHLAESRDGDIADGLEFTVHVEGVDTVQEVKKVIAAPADQQPTPGKKIVAAKGTYVILTEIYDNETSAEQLRSRLAKTFKQAVIVVHKQDSYKVEIVGFNSESDADLLLQKLEKLGISSPIIIKLGKSIEQ